MFKAILMHKVSSKPARLQHPVYMHSWKSTVRKTEEDLAIMPCRVSTDKTQERTNSIIDSNVEKGNTSFLCI